MNKFGLELLLAIIKDKYPLNQPSDAVFALIHWLLTSTKKFGCVGNGETFSTSDLQQPSELLPEDWNSNNKNPDGPYYTVRYRQMESNQKFVLKKVFSIGSTWQITLCRIGDDKVVLMSIEVANEVTDTDGYPFKNIDQVLLQYWVNLRKTILYKAPT